MRKINTGDCFTALRIIKAGNIRDELKDVIKTAKTDNDVEKVGIEVFIILGECLGNPNVEDLVYKLLSDISGISSKTIKEQPISETFELFKEINRENDLASFFNTVVATQPNLKSFSSNASAMVSAT